MAAIKLRLGIKLPLGVKLRLGMTGQTDRQCQSIFKGGVGRGHVRSLGCTARAVTPKGFCTERGLEATDRSRALQVALRHNCTGQTAVYTTQTNV